MLVAVWEKDSGTGDLERRKWAEETAVFLQGMLDEPVDSATSAAFREKTAGWITGLRLTALSLRTGQTGAALWPICRRKAVTRRTI